MSRILFLDIDGVFIPQRMYFVPGNYGQLVKIFDPAAVHMVNAIAEQIGCEFVIHSSWIRTSFHGESNVMQHMINQGLRKEYFHEDPYCKYTFTGDRWLAISDWLSDHPEVTSYKILDDEDCTYDVDLKANLVKTNFKDGILWKDYQYLVEEKTWL